MNAIGDNPFDTDFKECIVCETCVHICPVQSIRFVPAGSVNREKACRVSMPRRRIIVAAVAGVGSAALTLTGFHRSVDQPGPGFVTPPALIRPPGALPEKAFLARCIRCGECMVACPTNTLQPLGLSAGFGALLSPRLVPRRGPWDPLCNR